MPIPHDILAQINKDFSAKDVPGVIQRLGTATSAERIQRCIVFAARGHTRYFEFLCQLAEHEWRDVIMIAEYDSYSGMRLYDFNRPIPQARLPDGNVPPPDSIRAPLD